MLNQNFCCFWRENSKSKRKNVFVVLARKFKVLGKQSEPKQIMLFWRENSKFCTILVNQNKSCGFWREISNLTFFFIYFEGSEPCDTHFSKSSFFVQKFNFFGWKTCENVVILDLLAVESFDFTRKIVQKKMCVKNS